jgi:hypothetical protein
MRIGAIDVTTRRLAAIHRPTRRQVLRAALITCAAAVGGCSEAVPDAPLPFPREPVTAHGDLAHRGYERVGVVRNVALFEHDDPELIMIGAEAKLPAPPSAVRDVLLDYPRHPSVLERVAEATVLEKGDHWLLVYRRLRLPLVDDRDFTIRVTWGEDGGVLWIRYRTSPGGPPPQAGVVRVTRHLGEWRLFPADDGRATLARYESNIDMGGSLPMSMSRSGAVDELPALFEGMCTLLAAEAPCPSPR